MSVDVDDQQLEINEDVCVALTGSAEQCGNGTDTDASDPEEGFCGLHADSDRPKVTDFDGAAWVGLRDELLECVRSERDAYALATISPDIDEVWEVVTALRDVEIGDVEFSSRHLLGRAREISSHPDLDVDDHPLGYENCIALQGSGAKNHSCPNGAYGRSLLCGMHSDADIPGTILDEGEPGPDLEDVTVDGEDYLLVERRGNDLIVVDPREYELRRLEDVGRDLSPQTKTRLFGQSSSSGEESVAGDGGRDEGDGPEAPSTIPKYIREGLEKQSAENLRVIAGYATELASYREEEKQRELEESADQDVDETPEEWDDDEWEEELEEAREKADLQKAKGSLTTKTIDGRDYYYLQWRDGDKIRSQYVAPVTPASQD